jgi:L-ectoine synthase
VPGIILPDTGAPEMIVRNLKDAAGTSRCVTSPSSKSVRLLLAEDGMGFTFNVTTLKPGVEVQMCIA